MRLKISNPGLLGDTAVVTVDGEIRTDLLAVTVHLAAGQPTTATLTVDVDELDLDVTADHS